MSNPESFKDLCIRLEHFETPRWAVDRILEKEILTNWVIDPCVGAGVLSMSAAANNYSVSSYDIHDWGYPNTSVEDFLQIAPDRLGSNFSVLMNPPFSKACEFVLKSFELGARKVVCFQRFAWWESQSRLEFWENNPPSRIYICGDRADCWRHDLALIPKSERINPKTGKIMQGSPTAHAWFVWEKGAPPGTILGRISR